jgi:hypothetical protein
MKKTCCLGLAILLLAALAAGCNKGTDFSQDNPFLGRWYPAGQVGYVDFAEDGTASVQENGTISAAAYAFEGDRATVRVVDQLEDLYFLLRADGTLYYEKTDTVFTREPETDIDFVPSYEGVDAFIGDWVLREEDVVMLVLAVYEDGIFAMSDGESTLTGTYTVDGAVITLTAEENGETSVETMRLINDVTLYSESGGLTLILED